jgi:energy-converting hydrogenase Eha subunit A
MKHEKKVTRAYHRDLGLSIVVYVVLLVSAIHFGRPMAEGWLRTAILVTPMIGFGLMIRAMARHLARIDEYMRRQMLETFAIAAAITAGLSFTYGFLETAGFPRLSMFTVWVVMGASWGLVGGVRRFLAR